MSNLLSLDNRDFPRAPALARAPSSASHLGDLAYREAISAIRRDWRVIPLCRPNGQGGCFFHLECAAPGKIPLIPKWQKRATTSPAELERWDEEFAFPLNWGVVAGADSAGFILDIDPAKGGALALVRLEAKFGPLPLTRTVATGGGGHHKYFEYAPEIAVSGRSDAFGAEFPGLDFRAQNGGQVVLPGSLHASGRCYRWFPGLGPEVPQAPLPSWLRDLILKTPTASRSAKVPHALKATQKSVRSPQNGSGAPKTGRTRLTSPPGTYELGHFPGALALYVVRLWAKGLTVGKGGKVHPIREGRRNRHIWLFALACYGEGLPEAQALARCLTLNESLPQPEHRNAEKPHSEPEVRRSVLSAYSGAYQFTFRRALGAWKCFQVDARLKAFFTLHPHWIGARHELARKLGCHRNTISNALPRLKHLTVEKVRTGRTWGLEVKNSNVYGSVSRSRLVPSPTPSLTQSPRSLRAQNDNISPSSGFFVSGGVEGERMVDGLASIRGP